MKGLFRAKIFLLVQMWISVVCCYAFVQSALISILRLELLDGEKIAGAAP